VLVCSRKSDDTVAYEFQLVFSSASTTRDGREADDDIKAASFSSPLCSAGKLEDFPAGSKSLAA